jgi:hypothetical protein
MSYISQGTMYCAKVRLREALYILELHIKLLIIL